MTEGGALEQNRDTAEFLPFFTGFFTVYALLNAGKITVTGTTLT
jgi:hypothetical protein